MARYSGYVGGEGEEEIVAALTSFSPRRTTTWPPRSRRSIGLSVVP